MNTYLYKMWRLTIVCILLVSFLHHCDTARILGIIPTPSYSHQILYWPLWKELSFRGHQLTVLTTDPMNDPSLTNLTEINLHFTYELWDKNITELFTSKDRINPLKVIDVFFNTVSRIIDEELAHPEVQKLIQNETEHFDLVMIEYLFPTMFAFAERFKCPSIAITSLDAPSGIYLFFGNPSHPVLNPDIGLPFGEKLTFFERLASFLYNFIAMFAYMSVLPREALTVEKHFGKNYPSLLEISSKISMLFVNVNPIFHGIRPIVPAVIQIGGGIQLQPAKPLPNELKKILDNAPEGFIYFSLGTNVKSKNLSKKMLDIFLEVFAELPYTILWKFELEELPEKPRNVIISKWFPQQDIMRHPNIKLFITQGGLQSMEEAIFNHIPMVGIPFFGDQPTNIKRMESKGLGLSVDPETITKDSFKNTILEVISNSKYHDRVKELAQLTLDQPMTGLERAVWWTEYVLRHKGAEHLRSPAKDLPTYQYFLLDVIGFCFIVILIFIYLIYKIITLSFKLVRYFMPNSKVKVN